FLLDAVLWLRRPVSAVDLLRLGRQRVTEAHSAARRLGLPPDGLRFLGFPDHGLQGVLRHRGSVPFRSPFTRRDRVPYAGETRNLPYTRSALVQALRDVLDEVQPTLVLLPSPLDAHPDHRAIAATCRKLLAERGWLDRAWHYIIHGGAEWPLPKGLHASLPLARPPRGRWVPWHTLELTPEETLRKRSAVRVHHTQVWAMRRFLHAFVRRNELFTPDPYPARLPWGVLRRLARRERLRARRER
ncbi:MAG TPA: PIG-L family deacetylase, partial [Deinococcales bacterium]|nr:PIG-L family deacetylase [Deinococcales bacterium]